MTLIIKAEPIATTRIVDTCQNMCRIANHLDVWVESEIGGIKVIARPGHNGKQLYANLQSEIDTPTGKGVVFSS